MHRLITIQMIIDSNPHALRLIRGELSSAFRRVYTPESGDQQSVVLLSDEKKIPFVLSSPPGLLILEEKLEGIIPQLPKETQIIVTNQFKQSMAQILKLFAPPQLSSSGIHPTAVISSSAKVDASCWIGPYVIIEDHVEVGPRTRIDSHCVIEAGARIGKDSWLHPHVVVGWDCQIGDSCRLFSHVSLGSDGFGFIPQAPRPPEKIPQIGRVRLEDFVEIGAGTQIDRATLGETLIRKGAKLDNLCHIAHNCEIGENSLIAAGFMTAGSVRIGRNFMCGGDVVCSDHIEICDDVLIGGRSAVTSSITMPGRYTGYPLLPWREGLKALASISSLPELRRRVQELENRTNL
jgi:UDP-3-O-[3-hydroxymyristoyl] glucosamine N-acyltransferase